MTILTAKFDPVRAASATWQQHVKWAIRDVKTLCQQLQIPSEGTEDKASFPVFVPLPFLQRMQVGETNDPLLRQILPVAEENYSPERFTTDPLAEQTATLSPGLLQKYQGRALLITTGACAVHCRYCFRRDFPYSSAPKSVEQWGPALKLIRSDASVEEVILSGGDPFMLTDPMLDTLIDQIATISHVKRLRIHTRLPIMIPQRVTDSLMAACRTDRFQVFVVIHSNHANEFDSDVDSAIGRLKTAGMTLLNQTVLLHQINDDADTLIQLSKRLLQIGVLPYYLHQLDPIIGTSHFEVPRQKGRGIIETMRQQLPGYGVPRYVKELPGEKSKTIWE